MKLLKDISHYAFKLNKTFILHSLKKAGIENIGGHFLYLPAINKESIIVDIGANKGHFYTTIIEKYGCQCHAVEASPELYDKLPPYAGLKKYNLAIYSENGYLTFNLSVNPEANSINRKIASVWGYREEITVESKTFESFLHDSKIEHIDLLKIDIEGAEINMFNTTSEDTLCKIKQIAVEFHDFLDPSLLNDILLIHKRLRKLGFELLVFSNNDYREMLLINKKLVSRTFKEKINLYLLFRFGKSLKKARELVVNISK